MKAKLSLKKALSTTFIMAVTLPIVLISLVMLFLLTRNLEREITNKQMFLATALSGEIDEFLDEQQSVLGLIENYVAQERVHGQNHINRFLQSVVDNYQFFDMIQIVDRTGRVVHVAPDREDYLGINISGYSFFKEAYAVNRPYWSSVFTSVHTEQPTIAVTRPTETGMIVAYLNISRINDMIDRLYIGENGWAEVVDRNGSYIAHTMKSNVYQRINRKNDHVVNRGLTGYPGSYRYRMDGKEILSNVIVVPATGWPIIISQPSQDAFKSVQLARNIFLAGTCGAFLLASLIALGNVSGILRSIDGFAAWIRQIANGDYQNISKIFPEYREFSELAEDFLRMTEAVQSREKALRASEERYAMAVLGANDGLWDWDIPNYRLYFSPRWKEILGYRNNEIQNHPDEWFQRIHPDDYDMVIREIEAHFQGQTDHFHNEHRILHKNGSYSWVLIRGIAVRDNEGHPYRMAGSLTDITGRKRNEQRIKASLNEKEVLLREIHHRVKNNMQVICSLLRLQSNSVQDSHSQMVLQESQNRIRSMAMVHEKLYQSKDLTEIDANDYLTQLIHYLMRSYAIQPDQVEVNLYISSIQLKIDTAIPCGLIINELVTNALKYAFPEGRKGRITVSLRMLADDCTIEFAVADNGVGLPEGFSLDDSPSLGLQLVITLVRDQLQGEMEMIRYPGTSFRVRFREVKAC
ncbi:MAG TPA: histidine kinase dimerization/phosphoacceptor domain -containing protein [Bacillota bacterium]|nr:histidine kinase dimerization/phosphoacceptor domain -containing protein [Bacillota bacterium]HPT86935.1 histidine kinase dimerization/phosphoacceptor domain -containing protein [Bacillota bacterium]